MRTHAYFDLIETFAKPGCALCALALRDVDHFLDLLLYERVNEPDSHRAFRASRGLCSEHGGQLVQHKGGALAIAVLYKATVDEVLKVMAQSTVDGQSQSGFARLLNANGGARGINLADQLEPQGPCMACQLLADSEERYVQVMIQHLADARLQEAYRTSEGLCLPHFRQVLRQVRDSSHLRLLISIQTAIWEKLKAELQVFIDKNDHYRSRESMGVEGDSWQRAIKRMAGERGVFGVEPRST